ncbi:hypothetical protein KP509_29G056200 [Ceratopteris richardii]|uniref:DNA-directed DNA polymerase n=1 Tax=Ceratopteris richardii TaxID=49495 RepID=A0A8T2R745_CERRI|nr:hypothetical protein KP509_29G056200 [Ceratopteris richardii]
MCSCSKLMIMDVGQPRKPVEPAGELPLIRDVTNPKKPHASHHPTSKTSSLLEGLPANTQMEPATYLRQHLSMHRPVTGGRVHDQNNVHGIEHAGRDISEALMDSCKTDVVPKRSSCKSAKPPMPTELFNPSSIRSPKMDDFNAKVRNWDTLSNSLQHGTSLDKTNEDSSQQESLQSHPEKTGIPAHQGKGSLSAHFQIGVGRSLLHNWKSDNQEASQAFQDEKFELDPSTHAWNLRNSDQHTKDNRTSSASSFAFEDDRYADGDTFSFRNAGKGFRRIHSQKSDPQFLSPLMLNLHDHNYHPEEYVGQQYFSLDKDDPSFEDAEEDFNLIENEVQQHNGRLPTRMNEAKARPPLLQSYKAQTAKCSRFSEVQYGTHFNLRPGTPRMKYFKYDMETLDQKQSKKRESRISGKHSGKEYSYAQKQYSSPNLGSPRKTPHRKIISGSKGCGVNHNQFDVHYADSRSKDIEPLPLLTELEDYSGSDDYGVTSIDCDIGGCSMSKHEEELDRVSKKYNRKGGHGHGGLDCADQLQLAVQDCKELVLHQSQPRSLSQKYRPKTFEDLIGQPIVTQALSNAIAKGRIAPVYLFQGSRGTGKTTAARIFASALICISSEGQRPCHTCNECISVVKGMNSEVKEVDAASNNGIERVKVLLEETISSPAILRYKIFIIDECHVLTADTWNALLKILEEPPTNVVFILVTTDVDQIPRTALSRCQRFPFPRIKDVDIVKRLENLVHMENLSIQPEILQLIASRSDGSLRDAETTLDQVTLLGNEVNASTVHELVGCASDDKLLSLLDAALVADTVNTVRKARELVDSGMEPLSLMSRLASVIADILGGTFNFTENQRKGFFQRASLSEEKLEQLRIAMKVLAEAEKQLRASNDRAVWLTAALLQLGPERACMSSCAGTSVTQSPVALDDLNENDVNDFETRSAGRQAFYHTERISKDASTLHQTKYHESEKTSVQNDPFDIIRKDLTDDQRWSPTNLDDIWSRVLQKCQSLPLRKLLYSSLKLISISITEAHLEICGPSNRSSCERAQRSIAQLFEMVLGFPVEIKMCLASPQGEVQKNGSTQVSVRGNEGDSVKHSHIPTKHALHEGYSKSTQRRQQEMESIRTLQVESFPAIPLASSQKQNFIASNRKDESYQSARHRSSQADHETRVQGSEGLISMAESRIANSRTHGEGAQHIMKMTNDSTKDTLFADISDDEYRSIDEVWAKMPNSYEASMPVNSRLGHSAHSGQDGCESLRIFDMYHGIEEKQRGSDSKMIRRSSIRKQEHLALHNDLLLPEDQSSYMLHSRSSTKQHTDQHKYLDSRYQTKAAKQTPNAVEELAMQKKSKLKGAAGSFARFFQGKLNK